MANWSNVHLVVVGSRADVLAFGESARKREEYFTPEMRKGEGADLSWNRACEAPGSKLWEQHFRFQTAHDDEREHFRRLSRCHPLCWFLIAYADANADQVGGHVVRDGRCHSFELSDDEREEHYRRVGYEPNAEDGDDGHEVLFWDAQWAMLDACIEQGRKEIARWKG